MGFRPGAAHPCHFVIRVPQPPPEARFRNSVGTVRHFHIYEYPRAVIVNVACWRIMRLNREIHPDWIGNKQHVLQQLGVNATGLFIIASQKKHFRDFPNHYILGERGRARTPLLVFLGKKLYSNCSVVQSSL